MSKHRLEALSDGVFAVVMTLLVLEIKPELEPHASNEAVRHMLGALALPVLTYSFAFFISCTFWVLHHRKFAMLRHTNSLHTALTLGFLFTVTLLPVSVSIYLRAKANGLAGVVYFGNFTLIALILLVGWIYAQRVGLVDAARPAKESADLTRKMTTMTLVGLITIATLYFERPYLALLVLPVLLYFRLQRRKQSLATT